jgi:Uncharacterized protein conserved in bacteria
MVRLLCIFVFIVLIHTRSIGQGLSPLREFRAAWVATVGNIDWPSQKGLSAEIQKMEFLDIIYRAKRNGLNALIVQIRPASDAFYDSKYEDWSRYLSGKQGEPPSPYYDPLQFMIEACHKECIEFHAWFNPYRALVDATKNVHTTKHIIYRHPEWFLQYGGKTYFDPGLPEVREYFINVVMDVVKRYDIDAVHLDDYFYPYRIAKQEFPDYKSYAKYGSGFSSKDDWRRDNVNRLIEKLSVEIKKEKPYVKFGISPFGIWRNASRDPEGSMTNGGQTNYDDLYADVLLWVKKGWIDYNLPQLYWERGHRAADYDILIHWWSKHAYQRHLYIGHGLYQVGVSPKACWRSFDEINQQVLMTRTTPNVHGSAFYSANSFKKNLCNINEHFQKNVYPSPALLPAMKWIDSIPPNSPKLKINYTSNSKRLEWMTDNPSNEPLQFAVYEIDKHQTNTKKLIAIVRDETYTIQENTRNKSYAVTSLDRLHNQSEMSNVVD